LRRSLTPDEIKLVQVISFRTGVIPSREKERSQCYTSTLVKIRPSFAQSVANVHYCVV